MFCEIKSLFFSVGFGGFEASDVTAGVVISLSLSSSVFPLRDLRFIEVVENVCQRLLEYNLHKERTGSNRFAKVGVCVCVCVCVCQQIRTLLFFLIFHLCVFLGSLSQPLLLSFMWPVGFVPCHVSDC